MGIQDENNQVRRHNCWLLQKVKGLHCFIKIRPQNVMREFSPLFDGDTIISAMKSKRNFEIMIIVECIWDYVFVF
jgi:hypothetical protein